MAYHPVLATPRICAHCGTHFEAKDRRRIYCTSSCNTLAWLARQPQQKKTTSDQPAGLTFSLENIATVAVGSALTSGANYVFNDAPFYEALGKRLSAIDYHIGREAGKSEVMNKRLFQFIRAVRTAMPDVNFQLQLLEMAEQNKRLT